MRGYLRNLLRDARGATAVEYALVAVLIAIAVFGTMMTVRGELEVMWERVAQKLSSAA